MHADLRYIRTCRYLVAPKNDGERVLILCGYVAIEGVQHNYIATLTRDGRTRIIGHSVVTQSETKVNHGVYDGTLLDAEEMEDGTYICFDLYAMNGYDYKRFCLPDRLSAMHSALSHMRSECRATFSCKVFHPATPKNIRVIWNKSIDKNSKCDGIILAPRDMPVVSGRMPYYFKHKPPCKCTVDLMFTGVGFVCSRGEAVRIQIANGTLKCKTNRVYECAFQRTEDSEVLLAPVFERLDKRIGNSLYVYRMTLMNFSEPVTINALCDSIQRAILARV